MRWADERFVKIYTRDTAEVLALGWEARSLFWELLRKTDRAGIVSVGKTGLRGVAGLTGFPLDVVERAMSILLDDGCVVERPGTYVIRNFMPAQETPQSDRARKQAQRERDLAAAMGHESVMFRDISSQVVTPRREETSPDKTIQTASLARDGSEEQEESLLDVLARMVALGEAWGTKVDQRRQGRHDGRLTDREKDVLRKRQEEDARRAGGPHQRPVVTAQDEADARAMVEAYVQGHRRIIKDRQYVALLTHMADALKLLPDARRLAERAKRGDWKPTPAEVVAHKLETYLRTPRWGPEFAFRFLFDRTEQDDLPRPRAEARQPTEPPPERSVRRGVPLSAEEQNDLAELKVKLKVALGEDKK